MKRPEYVPRRPWEIWWQWQLSFFLRFQVSSLRLLLGNRYFFYLIVFRVVDFAVPSLKGIEEAVVSCIVWLISVCCQYVNKMTGSSRNGLIFELPWVTRRAWRGHTNHSCFLAPTVCRYIRWQCLPYCPQITSWSLRGVNVLSAVRGSTEHAGGRKTSYWSAIRRRSNS
jgi:hypothetical protein